MIKLFEMPMGGSVTLLSMLFIIVLIACWYGPYVGIMTAVAYGLVQFVTEPIFYTLPQMLLIIRSPSARSDLPDFFTIKNTGFRIGYIAGVLGRFLFSTASGVIFFASYAPEGMHPLVYSAGYQASYLVPEAVVTIDHYLRPTGCKGACAGKKTSSRELMENVHTCLRQKLIFQTRLADSCILIVLKITCNLIPICNDEQYASQLTLCQKESP